MILFLVALAGAALGFLTGECITRSYRAYRREFGYASSAHQPLAWLEFVLADVSIRDTWLRRLARRLAYRLKLIGVQ